MNMPEEDKTPSVMKHWLMNLTSNAFFLMPTASENSWKSTLLIFPSFGLTARLCRAEVNCSWRSIPGCFPAKEPSFFVWLCVLAASDTLSYLTVEWGKSSCVIGPTCEICWHQDLIQLWVQFVLCNILEPGTVLIHISFVSPVSFFNWWPSFLMFHVNNLLRCLSAALFYLILQSILLYCIYNK